MEVNAAHAFLYLHTCGGINIHYGIIKPPVIKPHHGLNVGTSSGAVCTDFCIRLGYSENDSLCYDVMKPWL